jgi:DNA mismatch repair ATPase MutS
MSAESKETEVVDGFDLALASKLVHEGGVVVCNDIALTGVERSIVVTGPNQGGKTTFARMFGQVHYLAGLGLPIPGRRARLFLADQVFTHFEREEHIEDLRGKLADELVRLREILELATDRSVVVMNEGFASTSLSDAVVIGTKVMLQVKALGALSIYVTFVDELASLDEATVSMVSLADEHDVSRRTLRVVRKPADGLAFALALATRYGLDYESLSGRIAS